MKKKITAILCLTLAVSLLAGCTTFNNFKNAFFGGEPSGNVATDRTIRIGVFEPLSGVNSSQGNLELIGIQLANELYPEVLGKKVDLIIADNQSDIYVAAGLLSTGLKRVCRTRRSFSAATEKR